MAASASNRQVAPWSDFPQGADPLARITGLHVRMPALAVLLAICFHLTAASGAFAATVLSDILAFQDLVGNRVRGMVAVDSDIVVEKEQVPEPEKPAEPPPPEPVKDAPVEKDPTPSEAPAPAAAQAGAILAAAPDPVDFTGGDFVNGTSENYAGGTTAANGTATSAVRNVEAKGPGVPNGTGTAAATAPKVSKARPASLKNINAWTNAPFPPEADQEGVDAAKVTLRVTVRPDGTVEKVAVIRESASGFGRAAAAFARTQRFEPALDDDGNPISQTKDFNVSYDR